MLRLLSLLAAALLLAGCASGQPKPQEAGPPLKADVPSAAIVAVRERLPITVAPRGYEPQPKITLWRVPLSADTTAEKLPFAALSQPAPLLSPDGRRILYLPWRITSISGPDQLHVYDLASREDTIAQRSFWFGSTFGWSQQGEVVTVEAARDFVRLRRPVTVRVGATTRTFLPDAFQGDDYVSFLATTRNDVFLTSGPSFFSSVDVIHIWRAPRSGGSPARIKELTGGAFRSAGQGLLRNEGNDQNVASAGVVLVAGTEAMRGKPDARGGIEIASSLVYVDVCRLPLLDTLRSVTVTPPAGFKDDRDPVFDAWFARYLDTTWRGGIVSLWEADASGNTRRLLNGKRGAPGPQPLGYAGEDFLFRSVESSRTVVRLFERASGRTRALADLGPYDKRGSGYYPATLFLGIQYQ